MLQVNLSVRPPKHIVILDSDPTFCNLIREVLTIPYVFSHVMFIEPDTSDLKFIKSLIDTSMDLIVIDYHLSVEDPVSFANAPSENLNRTFNLVKDYCHLGIPVVVWTTLGMESIVPEHLEYFNQYGVDVLKKPMGSLRHLRSWLTQKLDMHYGHVPNYQMPEPKVELDSEHLQRANRFVEKHYRTFTYTIDAKGYTELQPQHVEHLLHLIQGINQHREQAFGPGNFIFPSIVVYDPAIRKSLSWSGIDLLCNVVLCNSKPTLPSQSAFAPSLFENE